MRQTLSRGVVVAAAATSVLSLYGSPALADSKADGTSSGSPGVLSGNTVQVPVNVPINACGNTVDVVALLNPAFGNSCDSPANTGTQTAPTTPPSGAGNSDTGSVVTPPSRDGGSDTGSVVTPPSRDGGSDTGSVATPPRQAQPPAPEHGGHTPPTAHLPGPRLPAPAEEHSSSTSVVRPVAIGDSSRATLAATGSGTTLAVSGVSSALIAAGLILYRRGRAAHGR
ncbi:chaplin family protein [Streptomyces sp. NPDC001307]|uniref:chaplin n=1 Tax=Streptomyces sp. NPDC001307 TaxID=3364560 RepID=UPI0036920471